MRNYRHNDLEVSGFLVFGIQQLAWTNGNFPLETLLLVLLSLKRHLFILQQNDLISGSEYLVFIFDAQPVKWRLDIFLYLLVSWHLKFLEIFYVGLSWVAQSGDKHKPLLFLLLHVDFYLLEKWFTHSVGLKNYFYLRHFIRLDCPVHRNVCYCSRGVAVQHALTYSLD